jgi:hypothetical protein
VADQNRDLYGDFVWCPVRESVTVGVTARFGENPRRKPGLKDFGVAHATGAGTPWTGAMSKFHAELAAATPDIQRGNQHSHCISANEAAKHDAEQRTARD